MNRKNKPGFNDFASTAASAFEMMAGAQDKARDWLKGQGSRFVDQMELVTREDWDDLAEMISESRVAQAEIMKRLDAIEAQLGMAGKVRPAAAAKKPAVQSAAKTPAKKAPAKTAAPQKSVKSAKPAKRK